MLTTVYVTDKSPRQRRTIATKRRGLRWRWTRKGWRTVWGSDVKARVIGKGGKQSTGIEMKLNVDKTLLSPVDKGG